MKHESQNSLMSEVSSENTPKTRRHRDPDDPAKKKARQRRYHLRKEYEASGDAFLFTECRECGASIKPSYKRGFCANDGKCRDAFFKKVQVRGFVRIKHQISDLPTVSLLPVKTPARVIGSPRWDSPKRRLAIPANGMLSVLFPQDEPLFATDSNAESAFVYKRTWKEREQTALSVLFPHDEPLFAFRVSDWLLQPTRITKAKPKAQIDSSSREVIAKERRKKRRPRLFPPCVGVS
jgi:hypothetical protein